MTELCWPGGFRCYDAGKEVAAFLSLNGSRPVGWTRSVQVEGRPELTLD